MASSGSGVGGGDSDPKLSTSADLVEQSRARLLSVLKSASEILETRWTESIRCEENGIDDASDVSNHLNTPLKRVPFAVSGFCFHAIREYVASNAPVEDLEAIQRLVRAFMDTAAGVDRGIWREESNAWASSARLITCERERIEQQRQQDEKQEAHSLRDEDEGGASDSEDDVDSHTLTSDTSGDGARTIVNFELGPWSLACLFFLCFLYVSKLLLPVVTRLAPSDWLDAVADGPFATFVHNGIEYAPIPS